MGFAPDPWHPHRRAGSSSSDCPYQPLEEVVVHMQDISNTTDVASREKPQKIIEELLHRPMVMNPALSPIVLRRVQTLEKRQAPQMVDHARRIGVDIEYLGQAPLFKESRVYEGPLTDWVMAPAD